MVFPHHLKMTEIWLIRKTITSSSSKAVIKVLFKNGVIAIYNLAVTWGGSSCHL